jgi:hypothetical protein
VALLTGISKCEVRFLLCALCAFGIADIGAAISTLQDGNYRVAGRAILKQPQKKQLRATDWPIGVRLLGHDYT